MSDHNSIRNKVPKVVSLAAAQPQPRSFFPKDTPQLLIKGQGCVTFTINKGTTATSLIFNAALLGAPQVVFSIDEAGATFKHRKNAQAPLEDFTILPGAKIHPEIPDGYSIGIDPNPNCVYWVSIDTFNKLLRYGKGEMRKSTILLEYRFGMPPNLFTKDLNTDFAPYIKDLKGIEASKGVKLSHIWADPVVVEPPVAILATDQLTMTDAAKNKYVTPGSLSKECQVLYDHISGENFSLSPSDFPDFEQAIEYSIRTEGCLGHRIINHKLKNNEFTPVDKDGYREVYLRITLGLSQGNSPGIPYVMEIWPSGCGSPIHHHGYTHAVIKILRGAIDVDMYRMLPESEETAQSFQKATFHKGDVTYLMPQVNQFHRLRNDKDRSETCITIQCYSYAEDDDIHYPNFDYLEGNKVGHFDPISDYDFLAFKNAIKEEWNNYLNSLWDKY